MSDMADKFSDYAHKMTRLVEQGVIDADTAAQDVAQVLKLAYEQSSDLDLALELPNE